MNTLIDELMDEYYLPIKLPENNREGLKSELLKAILASKPEEQTADSLLEAVNKGILLDKAFVDTHDIVAIAVGYNQALTKWEEAIKELFGEK